MSQEPEPHVVNDLEGGLPPDVDQVSVRFSGPAAKTLEKLRVNMGVPSREKVVENAVKLLVSAQGKAVILRDRHGYEEVYELWKGS